MFFGLFFIPHFVNNLDNVYPHHSLGHSRYIVVIYQYIVDISTIEENETAMVKKLSFSAIPFRSTWNKFSFISGTHSLH